MAFSKERLTKVAYKTAEALGQLIHLKGAQLGEHG